MRRSRALWTAVGAAMVVTIVALVLAPFAPHGEDMQRLLNGAHSLISGKPPDDLLLAYPPFSAVQYVPIALLPRGVTQVLLRIAVAAIVAGTVVSFGRREDGTLQRWSLVLLISPPVINAVQEDQFNTALALLTLILAQRLLTSRRPWLAGLVAGVAMSRPFAAAPAVAGMLGGSGRRAAIRMAPGAVLFVGMTVGVAFAWDHNLLHDVAVAGARRPLVGPMALVRSDLGLSGVVVALTVVGVLCALIARASRSRPVDGFVAMIAVSCIGVHLGGPYVALFALPGLARLAAVASPWWAVGTTLAYATLTAVLALPATAAVFGDPLLVIFVHAPLVLAALPLWLLYKPRAAGQRTVAEHRTIPAIELA